MAESSLYESTAIGTVNVSNTDLHVENGTITNGNGTPAIIGTIEGDAEAEFGDEDEGVEQVAGASPTGALEVDSDGNIVVNEYGTVTLEGPYRTVDSIGNANGEAQPLQVDSSGDIYIQYTTTSSDSGWSTNTSTSSGGSPSVGTSYPGYPSKADEVEYEYDLHGYITSTSAASTDYTYNNDTSFNSGSGEITVGSSDTTIYSTNHDGVAGTIGLDGQGASGSADPVNAQMDLILDLRTFWSSSSTNTHTPSVTLF